MPHRLALTEGRIVTDTAVLEHHDLIIQGSLIYEIREHERNPHDVDAILAVAGRYITPGLIDIHLHGAAGASYEEPSRDGIAAISDALLRSGVTAAVPTLATMPIERLKNTLTLLRPHIRAVGTVPASVKLLGVHAEGPFLSREQRGAHSEELLRSPAPANTGWIDEFADILRIVTLAPEVEGALALIVRLGAHGILPAAGHSDATSDEVQEAVHQGLRHAVHLWSGQSTARRRGSERVAGLLEASLVLDDLSAEVIADGKHLSPLLLRLAFKCLGPGRLCVVSDATRGAGMPDGTHFRLGSVECEVRDGVGVVADGSSFAGSTTLLNQMVPIVLSAGIGLVDAVRMMTATPARIVGAHKKGRLLAGLDADIAILDEDFAAWSTIVGGEIAHGPAVRSNVS